MVGCVRSVVGNRMSSVEVGGFFLGVGLVEVLDHVSEGVDGVVGAVFFGGWA